MAKRSFSLKEPLSRGEQRTALFGWGAGALVAIGAYIGALQFLPTPPTTLTLADIQPFVVPNDLGVDPILTGSIGASSSTEMPGSPSVQTRLDNLTLELAELREAIAASQAANLSITRRLASLEESYSFVTASVGEQATMAVDQPLPAQLEPLTMADTAVPRVVLPAPVATEGGAVSVAMRPLDISTEADTEMADMEMDDMSVIDGNDAPELMDDTAAATDLVADQDMQDMPTEPAMDMISTTPFAVDIGGAMTLEEIDSLWVERQVAFGGVLDGYAPRILLQQTSEGALELRLVAGPIQDAADAALVCAQLVAAGMDRCLPAVFDGQQLALR